MSELKRLINDKRRLDDKIRLLKQGAENFGHLDSVRYAYKPETDDNRGWQVCAQMTQIHREHKTKVEYETNRWQTFIREKTKEEALAKIRQIIGDLSEVIDAWSKEEEQQ